MAARYAVNAYTNCDLLFSNLAIGLAVVRWYGSLGFVGCGCCDVYPNTVADAVSDACT